MVTLQETAVKFNNNLHASHTGGRLSSDSGLLLVDELMDAFHFEDLIKQLITFKENRRYWTHTNQKILKQMVLQLIAVIKLTTQRYSATRSSVKNLIIRR